MSFQILKLLIVLLFAMIFAIVSMSCNDNQPKNKILADTLKAKNFATNYTKGKLIFDKFCNGCHTPPEKKATDQIMFDNLFEKLPSPFEEHFIKYIKNSKSLKDAGDNFAKELSKVYNSTYEHNFADKLTDEEFYNLIVYMKVATK